MTAPRIIQAADLFCGAGGTSSGLYSACDHVGARLYLVAVNHWKIAVETHTFNHPDARHICAPLEGLDPRKAVPSGRLDILVASPECTHHSIARGGKPVSDQLRASAWHILRWAELLQIDNILIENVREFQDWGPTDAAGKPIKSRKGETFKAFCAALRSLNYTVEHRILNAADYGDPTSRHRLFIMARRGGIPVIWPETSHGGTKSPYHTAREIIDWDLPGDSIFKRKKALAPKTLARIAAGIRKYGGGER
jgi:DNA (cytosine-5)-methyltransferase 1